MLDSMWVNKRIWFILDKAFMKSPHLFPQEIKSSSDIRERIHLYRSFRRSSDSRAIARGVKEADIDTVHRWSTEYTAKGRATSQKLRIAYSDPSLLRECFSRYTQSM